MKLGFENSQELKEEKEKLFSDLVEAASAGEHTKFEFIRNLTELFVIKQSRRSLEKVVEMFSTLSDEAYRLYCKQVKQGIEDFNLLYAHTQYKNCYKFYEDEYWIATDMANEYWSYVFSGHAIEQLLALKDRKQEDLIDFRKGRQ
jgi:hypothetical protein